LTVSSGVPLGRAELGWLEAVRGRVCEFAENRKGREISERTSAIRAALSSAEGV
jgi:hypothetical protein